MEPTARYAAVQLMLALLGAALVVVAGTAAGFEDGAGGGLWSAAPWLVAAGLAWIACAWLELRPIAGVTPQHLA